MFVDELVMYAHYLLVLNDQMPVQSLAKTTNIILLKVYTFTTILPLQMNFVMARINSFFINIANFRYNTV